MRNNYVNAQQYSPYQNQKLKRKPSDVQSQQSLTINKMLQRLYDRQFFISTNKILNLKNFVQQNIQIRKKLLTKLQNINSKDKNDARSQNSHSKIIIKSEVKSVEKIKTQKLTTNYNNQQAQMQQLLVMKTKKQQQVGQLRKKLLFVKNRNKQTNNKIKRLQAQQMSQSIHQTPLLKQKQQQIQYMSIQIQWLNEKNYQLKKMVNFMSGKFNHKEGDVFQMYEKMCRQCQTLRKQNNKKSQQLKILFQKVNQLTGKQQNINMFLMNLKV